jgi:hypothetical protein
MIENVTTVARMQRYGNYAVAIRLAVAAASAKANDSTSPPHSGRASRSAGCNGPRVSVNYGPHDPSGMYKDCADILADCLRQPRDEGQFGLAQFRSCPECTWLTECLPPFSGCAPVSGRRRTGLLAETSVLRICDGL